MVFKIFFDANIIVDLLDVNRPDHQYAAALFKETDEEKIAGYLSESVINNSCYITRKFMTISSFSLFVQDALSFLQILPCTNAVIADSCRIVKNDFEDAVLYQIALAAKMNYFITNNIKDFKKIQHSSLPAITAKQMLALL